MPIVTLRQIAFFCPPFVEKLGTQKQWAVPSSELGHVEWSGCPALVKQAVDQTSDPVSGLSSIQSVKRRGSRSVAVQHRLGASNYTSAAGLTSLPRKLKQNQCWRTPHFDTSVSSVTGGKYPLPPKCLAPMMNLFE